MTGTGPYDDVPLSKKSEAPSRLLSRSLVERTKCETRKRN